MKEKRTGPGSEKKSRVDRKPALRILAERKAAAPGSKATEPPSPEETESLLHELQVHQIELELQNEELQRSQTELDAIRARYFELFDLAPVGYITISEQGVIIEANFTAVTLLDATRSTLVKSPITRFFFREDQDIYYLHRKQLMETGKPQKCYLRMVKKDGTLFWAHLEINATQESTCAPVHRLVIIDLTEQKQVEEALQKALEEVKILRGILPICSNCKKIRDSQGRWNPVEVYIRDHTDVQFSHGMCPECRKKLYPEYEKNKAEDGEQAP